jgi:hypothetical protein
VKAIAALLVAAAGLTCAGCGRATAAPDLDAFLTDLPSTLTAAGSPEQLRAALGAAPPEVAQGPGTTLHFPPREPHWLMTAWHLDRVYAVATDPHQQSWQLMRYGRDVGDPNGPRIALIPITFGAWTVRPQLAGRPVGPLPSLVAGASPAYDVAGHAAQVTGIDLEM